MFNVFVGKELFKLNFENNVLDLKLRYIEILWRWFILGVMVSFLFLKIVIIDIVYEFLC